MNISGTPIGDGPMYIIAEMSANHGGSLDRAKELLRAAATAGADAVKLQTYTADTMTIEADTPPFRIGKGTLWEGRTLYDLYEEAYTPWEWHGELIDAAKRAGITCFSTPFDRTAIDFLEELEVPAYKIASFECIDLELIAYAASTGKPLIISTGMATRGEIDDAVQAARANGCEDLALLRCNSAYPSDPAEMDLRTIPDMQKGWNCIVGLSDHTLGTEAALAARTLGASILEKHYNLDDAETTPDSGFSITASGFAEMVKSIRKTEEMLGDVRYGPTTHEEPSLAFRRSIFAVADIAEGEPYTRENVRVIRPGHGLPPKELERVLSSVARKPVRRTEPITAENLASINGLHSPVCDDHD